MVEESSMDALVQSGTTEDQSSDRSSGLMREESAFSMPYDESSTTLEEKSMQRLPTAFARTLSSIPSYSQTRRGTAMADKHLKIVVVGDRGVGKTCLLISYVQRQFPTGYVPTVFENYVTKVEGPKKKIIELALWDTGGQEEYNRLRPLSYSEVDILMVCYSVGSKASLQNVEDLWMPEVKHFCPNAPTMLLGLKSDLYDQMNFGELVDLEQAELVAQKLGAFSHMQCSAKSRSQVDEVFNEALNTALRGQLNDSVDLKPILKNAFKKKPNAMKKTVATSKKPPPNKKNPINKFGCTII
ncbi:hypothetical protein HG536_0F01000 [Torulaspora globosa]|uniref:GTP-binding protein RHO4 n=1 Tax=Torulaspora globosa TaxID=48254 RepID=A0A7G3ZJT9_9SACH|nr:uncharacterized protein HG536_0F01000 [Torulaspora globosa]QLL33775.1 hypothetical protein HG536_0F01000 [Torulaspora globosa]